MKDQPGYYSILTAEVRYSKILKPNEKLLFSEITALQNKNGVCSALNKYFAKLYEVEIDTVSRWISNLKKYGFIDVQIKYKDESKIIIGRSITLPIKKSIGTDKIIDTPTDKKVDRPTDKKVVGNITSINNTSGKKKIEKKKIQIPDQLNREAWTLWIAFKKQLKSNYKTPLGEQIQMQHLAALSYTNQMMCVVESVRNEYKGLFPDKHRTINYANNKPALTRAEQTIRDIRTNFDLDLERYGAKISKLEQPLWKLNS